MMTSFGLDSLINSPTRITKISEYSMDHGFYRSRDNYNLTAGKFDTGITEHMSIYCSIEHASRNTKEN